MYPKNAASPEPIAIGAVVQISDGAVQTSGCTVRVKPIGVAEGDGGGTTAYSTDGIVLYTPTQAETNYTSFILIAKKTGCIPVSVTVVTTSSATPGTVLLAPVTHTSAVVPTVTTLTNLPAITAGWLTEAGIADNAITAAKIAAGAIDAATFAADVDAEILSYIVDDATRIDGSALNTASGTSIPAILADTNELQTDLANGGRLDLLIDAILEDTGTTIPATITTIDNEISVIDGIVDDILVDTGTTLPATLATLATAANLATVAGYLDTEIVAILEDTGTTLPAQIAALNNLSSANVLTQVNAALDTAIAELSAGVPTATPTTRTALMLLYMALRNRTTTTASAQTIQNDAGTTIATATLSDDGTTMTKGEFA